LDRGRAFRVVLTDISRSFFHIDPQRRDAQRHENIASNLGFGQFAGGRRYGFTLLRENPCIGMAPAESNAVSRSPASFVAKVPRSRPAGSKASAASPVNCACQMPQLSCASTRAPDWRTKAASTPDTYRLRRARADGRTSRLRRAGRERSALDPRRRLQRRSVTAQKGTWRTTHGHSTPFRSQPRQNCRRQALHQTQAQKMPVGAPTTSHQSSESFVV